MKGRFGENKTYAVIAAFILLVVVLTVIFTSNHLTPAIIPNDYLSEGWFEDFDEREMDVQLLSSWYSYTYKNYNDSYPANVAVTSRKTLFLTSINDLLSETIKAIKGASKQGIFIDEDTMISGNRILSDGRHKTVYVVYNGTDNSSGVDEEIKVIGETWNCGISGASLICIGVAQITDNTHNNPTVVDTYWAKIVQDEEGTFGIGEYMGDDGLIYNVKCH